MTDASEHISGLEDGTAGDSRRLSANLEAAPQRSAELQQRNDQQPPILPLVVASHVVPNNPVPLDVEDFDRKNWDDPFQVSPYAKDIFSYFQSREVKFPIGDYMARQKNLTTGMRALLVDWMVDVQEILEVHHEALYLGVKIVDLYLNRREISKERLQLLGAAAFFIACKYEEHKPPGVVDFLNVCDGTYNREELLAMERKVLRVLNFDLGIPLSYRFLRRYARCAKAPMPTLMLARYILELSLMNYATISFSDSQMASAALFMALRMHGGSGQLHQQTWNSTLIYYTGYQLAEFAQIVPVLNAGLHCDEQADIKTIRRKYSHKIFNEVAKVQLLTNEELFRNNLDLHEKKRTASKFKNSEHAF
ncbi:G2/mitotic-specific cyclin-B3-like [Drosophila bipectinata]|uniref:G2/mitotic-specific cyclin-B3-like n=1 Tax=Drosophila bipectinata TaxID=42026 RepID=UPI0038B31723